MYRLLITLFILFHATLHSQNERYIFFLHNRFIETNGPNALHPEYGRAEYFEILNLFKASGFVVYSEIRPENTITNHYAIKIKDQVDSLIKSGTLPSKITIIGTSKGANIAMEINRLLKNLSVNFVFIGTCLNQNQQYYGNVLLIKEKSDDFTNSCQDTKLTNNGDLINYKELTLNTGLKHGFLFKR